MPCLNIQLGNEACVHVANQSIQLNYGWWYVNLQQYIRWAHGVVCLHLLSPNAFWNPPLYAFEGNSKCRLATTLGSRSLCFICIVCIVGHLLTESGQLFFFPLKSAAIIWAISYSMEGRRVGCSQDQVTNNMSHANEANASTSQVVTNLHM